MHRIFAIHGAYSTPTIFNYLRLQMPDCDWQFLDYHADISGVDEICQRVTLTKPCHVIGHSMGGLIALALAHSPCVNSITTIATPLDGLDVTVMQAYLTRSGFINEISHRSKFMQQLHRQHYAMPVQHIVTTKGFNPYIYVPNDGVVSVKSQRTWHTGAVVDIAANHAEVMLRPETVHYLRDFISNIA